VRVLAVQELLITTNVERLAIDAGIKVTPIFTEGDPKEAIVNEARNWKASTIFVGARGIGRVERVLLGSVSSTAVTHAPCTVEVVRGR
jgi:nucleotide-binding universal stress UspA family protein